MKHFITICMMVVCSMTANAQQTPIYLDDAKPIEQRIDDAIARRLFKRKYV